VRRLGGAAMPVILMVDDDPHVARAARRVLQRDGHDVLCAGTVREAMAILRSGRPLHLLLTDLNLARDADAGIRMAADARALRPHIHVIYMSGMGIGAGAAARFVPGARYLPKPFGPGPLKEAVRRADLRLMTGLSARDP
jgi:DNA-binding NtrC family response regulator